MLEGTRIAGVVHPFTFHFFFCLYSFHFFCLSPFPRCCHFPAKRTRGVVDQETFNQIREMERKINLVSADVILPVFRA